MKDIFHPTRNTKSILKRGLFASLIFFIAVIIGHCAFGQETKSQLTTRFDVIRNETSVGGNTRARIANAYQELSDGTIGVFPVTASGTDTYTGSLVGLDAYTGRIVFVVFPNNNTGASTLNLNSIGATTIRKDVSGTWTALDADDILAGKLYRLYNDGTRWQIDLGGSGGGGGGTWGSITGTLSDQTDLQSALDTKPDGSGTTNELPYWVDSNTLGSLTTGTYPSLTELSRVKGLTSAVQTQLDEKLDKLTPGRTITTSDDLDQTDNGAILSLNGTFNLTLDALSQWSVVSCINLGSGTITIVDGSGVTHSGASSIVAGGTATIFYETGTAPIVLSSPVVESVTGTSNRITVTGTTNPIIDIATNYAGQNTIATVGTLTAGATGAGFTVALGASTITGDLAYSNLTQGSALSVLGVAGNATADVASIAAGSDAHVLRRSGTTLGFGTIGNSSISDLDYGKLTGTVPFWSLASGGTLSGANTITSSARNQLNWTGTFTATTDADYWQRINTTITGSGTTGQIYGDTYITGTMTAGANSQQLAAIRINKTFATGGFSSIINHAILTEAGNITVRNGATQQFSIGSNGLFTIGSQVNTYIAPIDNTNGVSATNGFGYRFANSGFTTSSASITGYTYNFQAIAASTANSTSGRVAYSRWNFNFAASSANTTFYGMLFDGTLNQTGTSSGDIIAYDWNPTRTGVLGAEYGILMRPSTTLSGFGLGATLPSATLHVLGTMKFDGSVTLPTAGNGFLIKTGTNATFGTATLVGGTVTVNTTKTTANSVIILTSQTDGGTPGFLRISGRSAGTSFTVTSSSGTDTSTFGWLLIEPAP